MSAGTTQRSFRDPAGIVAVTPTRVLRAVHASGAGDLDAFWRSAGARRLLADGDIVSTTPLDLSEPENVALARDTFGATPAVLLEHARIRFAAYPYEWPAEMLHAAGLLTLRIARTLVDEDLGLKDATPFNVLFDGPRPVLIDVLSIERRRPGDSLWLAEAQFIRTFLIPLLLRRTLGMAPHGLFVASREGVPPEEAYHIAGRLRRLAPAFLRWVSLPTWLGSSTGTARVSAPASTAASRNDPDKARFILKFLLGRLERAMARVKPAEGRRSTWSQYGSCTHYDAAAMSTKTALVEEALDRFAPRMVLDVGCNTGRFSRLAAGRGASVVAIDLDPVVAGEVWRMAARENLDILPLVQNLAMPSPATGWWNRECPSFLDRAAGRFDLVLMLAVVHHLLVTDRIPLDQIVDLAAHLSTRAVVIEYVGPADPMFRTIARGREHLHADLTPETFEAAWARRFRLVERRPVGDTGRLLYSFERER